MAYNPAFDIRMVVNIQAKSFYTVLTNLFEFYENGFCFLP